MDNKCYQCGLTNWPNVTECGKCKSPLDGGFEDTRGLAVVQPAKSGGGASIVIVLGFVICAIVGIFVIFGGSSPKTTADAGIAANVVVASTPHVANGASVDFYEMNRKDAEVQNKKMAAMHEAMSNVDAQIRQQQQFTTGRGQGKWDNLDCTEYRVAANGVRVCNQISAR